MQHLELLGWNSIRPTANWEPEQALYLRQESERLWLHEVEKQFRNLAGTLLKLSTVDRRQTRISIFKYKLLIEL